MNTLRRWFNELLLPRRLRYAKITAVALWLAWLLSVVLGPGLMDLAEQVVGTDYLAILYAVGHMLRLGEGARLYDLSIKLLWNSNSLVPTFQDVHLYLLPPYMTWVFYPLAGSALSVELCAVERAWVWPGCGGGYGYWEAQLRSKHLSGC